MQRSLIERERLISDSILCNTDMCFDFDGVIHIYDKTTLCDVCAGEPVEGVMEVLQTYAKRYTIAVFSVRSAFQEGRVSMEQFVAKHTTPEFAESLQYPDHKPKSHWYFDDKAIRIDGPGMFPSSEKLESDRYVLPWYKRK